METKRTNREPTVRDQARPRERKQAKFSNYATLNAPKSCILDEVLQVELIPYPKNSRTHPMLI